MTKCSINFETILEKINGMYFCVDSMAGTILIADHKRPNVFEFSCGLKKLLEPKNVNNGKYFLTHN